MKLHKDKQRRNAFGGVTYTTLCGRMNRRSQDGMNIAEGLRLHPGGPSSAGGGVSICWNPPHDQDDSGG